MSQIKEKVAEAMKALGENCSWNAADKWMTQKYGSHGISDGTFYNSRSDIRLRGGAEKFLASRNAPPNAHKETVMQNTTPVTETPTQGDNCTMLAKNENVAPVAAVTVTEKIGVLPSEVTLEDVRKTSALLRQIGEGKILAALEILRELRG